MAIFGSSSSTFAAQNPESSLRLPAQKRISTAASARLSTITEGTNPKATGGNAKPRGIVRPTRSIGALPARPTPSRQGSRETPGRRSQDTTRTGPPAYTWVPKPITGDDEDLRAPVEGEKLAELRRNGGNLRTKRERGGWGRLLLIIGLVLLVIAALAVGLGIGLTRKHQDNSSNADQPASTTPSATPPQPFPLGEYSMITALRTVEANCTPNPVTWRCYPYAVYDPSDGSTNTSSLATFNWILANTSSVYATNLTKATSPQGLASNLTISSTNNPFSITFPNQPLTYIPGTPDNATSARYTFSFTQQKSVIPSTSLLSSGAAAECFFNSTTFTGTLYLDAPATFPRGSLMDETGIGGYAPWPYAVEISQRSGGDADVPACYEMVNGGAGARILTVGSGEAESDQCLCDYRNF